MLLLFRRFSLTIVLLIPIWLAVDACLAVADPGLYEVGTDPDIGFNLISWWNFGGSGASTWENAVQSIHDAGFREVSISPVRYVTLGTGSIATTSPKGPELSHIAAGIARAKSLGMRVTVNAFVEPVDFAMWRGQYDPTPGGGEWTTFWNDYENYLVDVALVAETNGADAMTVGTELKAIVQNSGNNAKWNSVINAVNGQFSGSLGYAANWDNFENNNLKSTIWEHPAIDFIGIDAYFENLLTTGQADASGTNPNPTFISQVEAAWNDKLDNDIVPFAAQRKGGVGMPVEFTEVGYLPYNRTSVTPQNSSGTLDSDEQLMAFNGLLRALDGRADEFPAMQIWNWGMPGTGSNAWDMGIVPGEPNDNNLATSQWLADFVQNGVPGFSADFNVDGSVDAADLGTWQAAFGSSAAADADGDGDSDGADFLAWQQQFGSGISSGISSNLPTRTAAPDIAVPEPSTRLLLAAVGICLSIQVLRRPVEKQNLVILQPWEANCYASHKTKPSSC